MLPSRLEKYRLSHVEKENLVDLICALKFKQQLPGYQMQTKFKTSLDKYINERTLSNVPKAIEAFIVAHPR